MSNRYVQPGKSMPVVLAGDVAVNDVDVIGTGLLGIAKVAGVTGETIEYAIKGVFRIPKVSGAVIAQGEQVLWDSSAGAVNDDQATPASGDFLCGYAFEAAGNGVTEILVAINEQAPSVT